MYLYAKDLFLDEKLRVYYGASVWSLIPTEITDGKSVSLFKINL